MKSETAINIDSEETASVGPVHSAVSQKIHVAISIGLNSLFTRIKIISIKCIQNIVLWKPECFVEYILLKLIYSGKAFNSQTLWHS